ncbi:hypothetical protein UlMin_027119 [Ulmus minor]
MGTVGFRPPQLSEELAWIPGWLHHQVEHFDECIQEPLCSSKLAFEDLTLLEGNICGGKDVILLPREEGTYNSCHLFLSGEDNSAARFASSFEKENGVQFHLHLSSDEYSQCPLASKSSQTEFEHIRVSPMQQLETSIAVEEKTWSKMSFGGFNSLPLRSNVEPYTKSPGNGKDIVRNNLAKFSVQSLPGSEINDAVELSVAASEALVIYEIAKSMLDLEAWDTTNVLEVALRVKKARLEWLEESSHCATVETDENDSLSEMDDFAMTDAFVDVGLDCSNYDHHVGCSSVSQVKETPVSQNNHWCENHSGFGESWDQQVNTDNIATQKQIENDSSLDAIRRKDLSSEPVNCEMQTKCSDDPVMSLSIPNAERENDPSGSKIPSSVNIAETVGFTAADLTSSQHQVRENTFMHASSLRNIEDRVTCPASERFRSRWLGGWTAKVEVNASAKLKLNNTMRIPKAFADETSFLSESADIAPDQNSLVQVHETKLHGESQSSIGCEGLLEKVSEGMLLSQDVVSSPSLSLMDPLCSIVPCTLSSENANTEAQNQSDTKIDTDRHLPGIELGRENSCSIANLNVEVQLGNEQVVHTVDRGYKNTVRRQLTSLKLYSMSFPDNIATADGGRLHYNQSFQSPFSWGLLTSDQNLGCSGATDKLTSKQLPLSSSVCKSSARRENDEVCETMLNMNGSEKLESPKRTFHDIAGSESKLPVPTLKGSKQPLVLNRRASHRVQASKPSTITSFGEEHSKQASGPENVIRLLQCKRPKRAQPESKNFQERHFTTRKRVCFSETKVHIEPNKDNQEPQSSKRMGSTMRTYKKIKNFDKWTNSRAHEKGFLTNCCYGARKGLIFQGMQFLLTGFSTQKKKDIKGQIEQYGGMVLLDIPKPPNSRGKRCSRSKLYQLPIILCSEKLRTTKFLYGCAANAYLLKVDWLADSVGAGSIVSPEKYMILPREDAQSTSIGKPYHYRNDKSIFESVGVMLHGKRSFYTKLAKVVKHGGGQVFKTLQWLVHSLDKEKISVGTIITEDDNMTSRHLRQCAFERQIPVLPASWIIKSLYSGRLLPFTDNDHSSLPTFKIAVVPISQEPSQEI